MINLRWILSLLTIPFISSCAHEKVTPKVTPVEVHGRIKSVHINAPDFLNLTSNDIEKVRGALKKVDSQNLSLSDEQTAECQNHVCHLNGKNIKGEFTSADFKKFSTTLKKAQRFLNNG